ncbi:TetR/AcrR family transcriptional regulator [Streptococcus dentiloxodontae]
MAQKRHTESKNYLKEALTRLLNEKRFEDITISDLSKTAGLNRGTFYLHYTDKYDMLDQLKQETLSNLSAIFERSDDQDNTRGIILAIFNYIESDLDFIVAISKTSYVNFGETIKTFVYTHLSAIPNIEEIITNHYRVPFQYAIEVYLASVESLVSFWLKNGAKENAQEITDIIFRALSLDQLEDEIDL